MTAPRWGYHPATWSLPLLDMAANVVEVHFKDWQRELPVKALDPFAGNGRKLASHRLFSLAHWHGLEIEPAFIEAVWVEQGDATAMRFPDSFFQLVVTSPTFGNRMADKHAPKDGSRRVSYTFSKREAMGVSTGDASVQLEDHNTGGYPWGDAYRALHDAAWLETVRVMEPSALIILNAKNFRRTVKVKEITPEPYVSTLSVVADGKKVKARQEVDVVHWHAHRLHEFGIDWVGEPLLVATPGMRNGQNREARAEAEALLVGVRR